MSNTFDFCPAYGAVETVQPRVRSISFGDGYEQRASFGINTQPRTWSLTFQNKNATETGQIEAFFASRAGVQNFDWTPPTGSAGKWICRSWSKSVNAPGFFSINATFEEVFEA